MSVESPPGGFWARTLVQAAARRKNAQARPVGANRRAWQCIALRPIPIPMPENKNQHFVPRCALKPFSLDGAGLAINVFNIPRGLSIRHAPVKSQCARNYLYGKGDNSAEGLLARLEGQYANIVSGLSDRYDLSEAEKDWLRLFLVIRQRRTESAISQMRELRTSMEDKVFARAPEHQPDDNQTDAQIMHASLALALEFKKLRG